VESADSLGNLVAYGVLWAFVALCVFLVLRWTLLFVAVVAIGLAEKYESLPAPLRRWLLRRAARTESTAE
jgi:hypothetical protein